MSVLQSRKTPAKRFRTLIFEKTSHTAEFFDHTFMISPVCHASATAVYSVHCGDQVGNPCKEYTCSPEAPTTGKAGQSRRDLVISTIITSPNANPVNETHRESTAVRSPIVDVTNMNTAAILIPNVFISS